MPQSVPPPESNPPNKSDQPPSAPPSPFGNEPTAGGANMTEFMKMFTPDERKKFMNLLIQNITNQIQKASKKYIEELKKEREKIEQGE